MESLVSRYTSPQDHNDRECSYRYNKAAINELNGNREQVFLLKLASQRKKTKLIFNTTKQVKVPCWGSYGSIDMKELKISMPKMQPIRKEKLTYPRESHEICTTKTDLNNFPPRPYGNNIVSPTDNEPLDFSATLRYPIKPPTSNPSFRRPVAAARQLVPASLQPDSALSPDQLSAEKEIRIGGDNCISRNVSDNATEQVELHLITIITAAHNGPSTVSELTSDAMSSESAHTPPQCTEPITMGNFLNERHRFDGKFLLNLTKSSSSAQGSASQGGRTPRGRKASDPMVTERRLAVMSGDLDSLLHRLNHTRRSYRRDSSSNKSMTRRMSTQSSITPRNAGDSYAASLRHPVATAAAAATTVTATPIYDWAESSLCAIVSKSRGRDVDLHADIATLLAAVSDVCIFSSNISDLT